MDLPETTFESCGHSVKISGLDDEEYVYSLIKQDHQFYEFDLLDFVRHLPLGDGSAVDVGANLGNHTVFFALVMQRRTHAFEVSSKNRVALRVNVEANDIADLVEVHDFGLHSEDALGSILENPKNMGQTRVVSIGSGDDSAVVLKRLDSVIPEGERIALIKVDVEGAELDVLRGSEAILDRDTPICLVEGHPGPHFDELAQFFAVRGFSPVQILGRSDNWVFVHHDRLEFLQPYVDAFVVRTQNRMLANNESRLRSIQSRADQTTQSVAAVRAEFVRSQDQGAINARSMAERHDAVTSALERSAWALSALDDRVRLIEQAQAASAAQIRELSNRVAGDSRRIEARLDKVAARLDKVTARLVPARTRILQRAKAQIRAGARRIATNRIARPLIMVLVPRRIRRSAADRLLGRRTGAQKSLATSADVNAQEQLPPNPLASDSGYDLAIICPAYPGGKRVYGGEFVKSRVDQYQSLGHRSLVIVSDPENQVPELANDGGVDVLRISPQHLSFFLRFLEPAVGAFLSHSPSPQTLADLNRLVPQERQVLWFHGYEVRDYRRLYFNYTTAELARLRSRLDTVNRERLGAAANCFADGRTTKVFVSDFLRRIAEFDTSQEVANSHVIPNFVDGDFYQFTEKTPSQASRMLLIRSFANRNYANDIAIEAIALLSDRPGFDGIHFTIRGFGPEFKPLTARLSGLDNVDIEEGLLSRDAIAALHADHGVFICPTRFDTQGVSMGEAMASGMVVVTNDTAAIPEFTDRDCSVLVRADDPVAYAEALWDLYEHPMRLPEMSRRAGERVRIQCGFANTIQRELVLVEQAKSARTAGQSA